MVSEMQPRVCADQAREIVLDWLIPLTENGTMDQVFNAFIQQLAPYAADAARRALRQHFDGPRPEVIIAQLRSFLLDLAKTFDDIQLDPDMMAISFAQAKPINEAAAKVQDWIYFLDSRSVTSLESAVPPAADVILARGDVP